MADIAMLVAEEYERRVKNSRSKVGAQTQEINFDLVSNMAAMAQGIKNNIKTQTFGVVNLTLEPKSQIGVAACNGAFSA